MKKVFIVIGTFFILSLFSRNAFANQTVTDTQIVESFCQDSNLYTYVYIPKDKVNKSLISTALIDNTYSYKQSDPIAKVTVTKKPVSYLFLVDISTSMPGFKTNINKFVNNFMNSAGNNASYSLVVFGKKTNILCPFTKNKNKIQRKLSSMKYKESKTSLYSSINNTIDYYEKIKRTKGELYNLIIISDGIEADKEGILSSEVEKKIKSSSIIIHTFGLPTKSKSKSDIATSEQALKILGSFARDSSGVYTVLGYENKNEANLAGEITDYINNLFFMKFNISNFQTNGAYYPLELTFATTGENGSLFEAKGKVYIPSSSKKVASKIGQNGKKNGGAVAVFNNHDGIKDNIFSGKIFGIYIFLWLLIIIVIILLIIILCLFVRKRKKDNKKAEKGIYIKVEVISENCLLKHSQFYLINELMIGRTRECDIRLKNKDVSKRNSRLFARDNIIYIEDLNSTNGTTINNMRIYAPNKLRSGDIISIGSVKLILKF